MKHLGTVNLESKRLTLRKFQDNDYISMYHNWGKYEECSRFFPWNPISDIHTAQARMNHWIVCYKENTFYQWGIELKENQELIGIINLHNVDEDNHSGETSYILSPQYWGNGIMTEALDRVLKFAFFELKLNRVQADCFEGNQASQRVLEKCGMICEGINREKYYKNGKYINSIQFAMTRGDLEENKTIYEKAVELLNRSKTLALSVIDENNFPVIYPMEKVISIGLDKVLFITKKDSHKVCMLKKNNQCCVEVHTEEDMLCLRGYIKICEDEEEKQKLLPAEYMERLRRRGSRRYCIMIFEMCSYFLYP